MLKDNNYSDQVADILGAVETKPKATRKPWTREELKASVLVYLDMYKKEKQGESFSKKPYYVALSNKFGRSASSFEYRMQNISHVFTLLGRDYVSGLKPASNVGKNMIADIKSIINECEA